MKNLRTYGLIGYPVKHSFSPDMHNAAFSRLRLNATYGLFEVEAKELESFLAALPSKLAGCNVTIPHKVAVRDYIGKNGNLSAPAQKIGAVNTIIVKDGKLIGDNTDGRGFIQSLQSDLRFNPADKTIAVIGAGGAARSIVMELGPLPKRIMVIDIMRDNLKALQENYEQHFGKGRFEGFLLPAVGSRTPLVQKSDLLINASPVGMDRAEGAVVDWDALHNGLAIFDVIYNPAETTLIKMAKQKKIKRFTNGIGMLLYQGALAFELWTGKKAPVAVMRKALERAIKIAGT